MFFFCFRENCICIFDELLLSMSLNFLFYKLKISQLLAERKNLFSEAASFTSCYNVNLGNKSIKSI